MQTPTSRRDFLATLGLGAATVAVAGAGGLTWAAAEGGVFATGTGPAYLGWDTTHPGLIGAATLAANAHNTQPWLFRVSEERIDLFADTGRTIGAIDPLLREMYVSLGCCLENLVLAGPPNGRRATVTLMPDAGDQTHVARVDLTPAEVSSSALFEAIPLRHTNRAAYDTGRTVSQQLLDDLYGPAGDQDPQIVWFTSDRDRAGVGDLTIRATEQIIADEQQAADDFAWFRTSWKELQSKKDGITIDASGLSPLIRTISKVVPLSRKQNHDGWLRATRDTQIPTAAAFGVLLVSDPLDPVQRLNAGRVWQRMHLTATTRGLAMQPLCQIPERIDRERSAGLAPDITTAFTALAGAQRYPLMVFRLGFPTTHALPSPRRPTGAVVLAG